LFEHALATLGVAAERTLFVGDDPEWDIAGAQRAGLAPVLLGDAASAPEGCRVIPRLADIVTLVERN
jgi:FMN phosphatase YigB (HAD superfamily)